MNKDVFFENFELLADAPNGVQKLRELILQLAVMGKLVPQNPDDEPASFLLERIKAENKKKGRKGGIENKSKASQTVEKELLSLPSNWVTARLGDLIYSIVGGGTPSKRNPEYWEGDIPWASVKDLGKEKYLEQTVDKITELGLKQSSTNLIPKGRVILCTRMGLGKIAINKIDVAINQDLKALHLFEEIDLNYFYNFYLTQNITGSGMTVKGIRQEDLLNILVPLPPLAEQKRIVSKVDELMALCDQLETRQQKKKELRSKLNSAALDKMFSAENQDEFEENWRRICENFDLLYDNPENVEELRKAVLQLAVQGKLVEQDEGDEPASVLIEKVKAENKKLIKEGKIRKTKKLQPIGTEETPYSLPNGWLWTRFGNIAPYIEAGWSPMCEKRPKEGDEWGVLKISAVSWGIFNPLENKALPPNLKPRPEYEVKTNDFLMSRANTSELVGRSVIVEDTPPELMINDKVLRLFFSSFAYKKFYNIFNNSQTARFYYAKEASGTSSSMKNISREVIYNMPVPIPPLNEQKLIVEKIEQLMGLCDELEGKLRKAREDSGKLMEMVVRGLLKGTAAEI